VDKAAEAAEAAAASPNAMGGNLIIIV